MQSIRAFILALFIHLLIIGSVVWWMQDEERPVKVYKEPRILLSLQNPYVSSVVQPRSANVPSSQPKEQPKKVSKIEQKVSEGPAEEQSSDPVQDEPLPPTDRVKRLIERHYGELFEELTPAEKQYIIANILTIHRIDRKVGNALLADKPRDMFQDGESNFVEMYLHPDGTLSDITIISEGKNKNLDELTMETVERSYSSYPRPNQKTLIRLHTRIFKSKQ